MLDILLNSVWAKDAYGSCNFILKLYPLNSFSIYQQNRLNIVMVFIVPVVVHVFYRHLSLI
jgi:hypothetical protein